MVTDYSHPNRKVTVNPFSSATPIHDYVNQIDVWRVENGVDYAQILLADTNFNLYDSVLSYGQDIAIYLNYESVESPLTNASLRFYGFIEDIIPNLSQSGEFTAIKLRHYGRCLLDMICKQEYGSESSNPTLNTIALILQNNTNGVIDRWINKLPNTAGTTSGYNLNDTYIEDIAGAIRYIYSPLDPSKNVVDSAIDVVQAIKGSSAGPHYIIKTEGNTNYFLLATVGNHTNIPNVASKWPTWWNVDQGNSTIIVNQDMAIQDFIKQRQEANYIIYHGAFRKPISGDVWTELTSGSWGITAGPAFTLSDDPVFFKVGLNSLKANSPAFVGTHYIYYPDTAVQSWSYNTTLWSGKFIPATLNFYCAYSATGAPTNMRVQMRTGNVPGADFYYVDLYPTYLPLSNTWFFVSLPIGGFDDNPQTYESFNNFGGWIQVGSPDWADIDCVEFSFSSAAVNTNLYWDGLYLGGYVTRGAKKSGESYYKIKVIRDDFAKDDVLKSGTPGTTDVGTLAQLAKAELYRAASSPITGIIRIPAQPSILAGQLAHIHGCKRSNGTFSVDKNMRITEHHLIWGEQGFFSELTLTDDVTNGIPMPSISDSYNNMLRFVNPDSQNTNISTVKLRKIDITHSILEESYTF
jgi:hypothetical protein